MMLITLQKSLLWTRSNPGRGWVYVNSESLSVPDILKAMKKGDFYSSTGVELDTLQISKEKIHLKVKKGLQKKNKNIHLEL